MKNCYKCKTVKPHSEFYKSKNRSDGLNSRCKPCQIAYNKSRYDKDPESFKLKRIKSRYNIDAETYYEMTKNGCEVCGSHKLLHIDHDHSCCGYKNGSKDTLTCGECIRGVLCKDCNTAEGLLHGDVEIMKSLIKYMEKFNAR